ncbi:MAG: hypothetical protein SCK70_08585 [bacterium]|nr:hypothetical protein [bacterium]
MNRSRLFSAKGVSIVILLLAMVSAFIWLSCEKATQTPVEPPSFEEKIVLSKTNPQVQEVLKIQNRHSERLMEMPGVVGTATGLDKNGNLVVKVFTEQPPEVLDVPKKLDGVPVYTEYTGKFVAYSDPTARFPRPVPNGS